MAHFDPLVGIGLKIAGFRDEYREGEELTIRFGFFISTLIVLYNSAVEATLAL